MEQVEKKKNKGTSFMKNVLFLMCSEIIVKILGLVYRLVITNVEGFGDAGLGYYSAGYQIYALLLTLCSIGIPSVIAKLVSLPGLQTCSIKSYIPENIYLILSILDCCSVVTSVYSAFLFIFFIAPF